MKEQRVWRMQVDFSMVDEEIKPELFEVFLAYIVRGAENNILSESYEHAPVRINFAEVMPKEKQAQLIDKIAKAANKGSENEWVWRMQSDLIRQPNGEVDSEKLEVFLASEEGHSSTPVQVRLAEVMSKQERDELIRKIADVAFAAKAI